MDDKAHELSFHGRALAAPVRALAFEEDGDSTFLYVGMSDSIEELRNLSPISKHRLVAHYHITFLRIGMGSQLAVHQVCSDGPSRLVWEGQVLYTAAIWSIKLCTSAAATIYSALGYYPKLCNNMR